MKSSRESISEQLRSHYQQTFQEFGANSQGVDWGEDESRLNTRYDKMLDVINRKKLSGTNEKASLLDVGCGFGGLLDYAIKKGIDIDYSGIDLSSQMIDFAKNKHRNNCFEAKDIFDFNSEAKYDFVVCNGILTQKLETSISDMNKYANDLIKKLYSLCKVGIAFNIMSTQVNFMSENLYYRHPADTMIFCLNEISDNIVIEHAYGLYEYTVYCYR